MASKKPALHLVSLSLHDNEFFSCFVTEIILGHTTKIMDYGKFSNTYTCSYMFFLNIVAHVSIFVRCIDHADTAKINTKSYNQVAVVCNKETKITKPIECSLFVLSHIILIWVDSRLERYLFLSRHPSVYNLLQSCSINVKYQ